MTPRSWLILAAEPKPATSKAKREPRLVVLGHLCRNGIEARGPTRWLDAVVAVEADEFLGEGRFGILCRRLFGQVGRTPLSDATASCQPGTLRRVSSVTVRV
eukprot:1684783-Prymnesium_polylepis.1